MTIPRTPLILGLAGLLPFLWGALTIMSPEVQGWAVRNIGARFVGPYVVLFYGAVILSFMSGVLWGFATKLEGSRAATGYILSVIPALWVFFTTGGWPVVAGVALMIGFLGILIIDWFFWRTGAAPPWWMQLRLILTSVVIACLAVSVVFG